MKKYEIETRNFNLLEPEKEEYWFSEDFEGEEIEAKNEEEALEIATDTYIERARKFDDDFIEKYEITAPGVFESKENYEVIMLRVIEKQTETK